MIRPEPRILSLHGYNSSHEGGFEGAVAQHFSKTPGVDTIDLLGHAPGKQAPDLYPLREVIEEGVRAVTQRTDESSVLFLASFAGYCGLEALRRGARARAVVLLKPMVDVGYTMRRSQDQLEPVKDDLRPEEATETFAYGTPKKPFYVSVPTLVLPGTNDQTVGDWEEIRQRVRGESVEHVVLEGPHHDRDEERRQRDIETMVGQIEDFLARIS